MLENIIFAPMIQEATHKRGFFLYYYANGSSTTSSAPVTS